jgi:hypothetical protein
MERIQSRAEVDEAAAGTIYYEVESDAYIVFEDGDWRAPDAGRLEEVLDEKAYIDMPNQSFMTFLNPRNVYLGLRLNF